MGMVNALPVVIRILSVVGTVALLLVSGGIFVHNIPFFHHFLENIPKLTKRFNKRRFSGFDFSFVCKAI